MDADDTVVIVGASLAGAKTADALRKDGFAGRIVLIGTEPHLPYHRPALTKKFLIGNSSADDVLVEPLAWYADQSVELRLDTTVVAVEPAARTVGLSTGETITYTKLVLATGGRPRVLEVDGADAEGIQYLRTIEDSDRLRELFATNRRAVIIGAGWIGLEVAAAARLAEVDVAVVEVSALPLQHVLGPEIGQVFADLHREHGVDFYFERTVDAILTADGLVVGVRLDDGTELATNVVVVAIGAEPALELAIAAELDLENGVLVDASLRTSDPDIYAVGDVAVEDHPFLRRRVRVEHWANALNQPAVAAAALLGRTATYDELPYFYSDQYDLSMEYVGLASPGEYDQVVVRGDLAKREFVAFWLSAGRVKAGMNVNVWDVSDEVKTLIRSRRPVDPAKLADPAVALDDVYPS